MIVISQVPVQPRLPVNPYRSSSMLVPSAATDINYAMPQVTPNVVFQPLQGYGYEGLGELDANKKKLIYWGAGALVAASLVGYLLFKR